MKKSLILGIFALAFLSGCKDDPKIYPASSKVDGINDTWVLKKVYQLDPANKDEKLDISFVFTEGDPIELTINSADFSYTFNNGDPIYLGNSGSWSFDDNNYPTSILINPLATPETLKLLRSVRTVDPTLEFQLDRSCDAGKTTTSYQFIFERK